ncbi:MAG: CbiX/SirB N-terminal domain-containing protein, partial [Pirellulales bacterium]|nr:CbiX/SirB N-terminal domain-containing protein [Pirellulales bacterium]
MPETGVVVVGHGTANPVGAAETKRVVAQVDAILPNIPVELGFLEVIEPTIEMALGRLAAQGCKRVVALPILLFSAGHAKQDVPQSLREAAARYGLSVT